MSSVLQKIKDKLKGMVVNETRIILGEPALRALLRGGEVTVKDCNVKMILQDIGFGPCMDALTSAMDGQDHYKGIVVNSDGDEVK